MSKKTIIILVSVGVVLLLGAAAVVAVAVGIFIFKSGPRERPYDPPKPANLRTANSTQPVTDKTEALVSTLQEKGDVGAFKLQSVIRATSSRSFQHSWAEVKGIYAGEGETVSLIVAQYDSSARATVEFGRMLGRERSRGAKVTSPLKVSGNTIRAEYETERHRSVAFCNWGEKLAVLCHVIESGNSEALEKFREGLKSGR